MLDVVDIYPIAISVALDRAPASTDDCITKRGLLPLTLSDGTYYYQTCFYCANMVETIISLAAILASSNIYVRWTQEGFKDPTVPGSIRFTNHDGLISMYFQLHCWDSLYCATVMSTQSIRTLSMYIATAPLLLHCNTAWNPPLGNHHPSHQPPGHGRWNLRCGCSVLACRMNINSMSSLNM
jgi:hypothetical protein